LICATKGRLALTDTIQFREANWTPTLDYTDPEQPTYLYPDLSQFITRRYETRHGLVLKPDRKMYLSRTSLVIVPAKVLPGWLVEIEKHISEPMNLSRKTRTVKGRVKYAPTKDDDAETDYKNPFRYRASSSRLALTSNAYFRQAYSMRHTD
jgi:hypothetical protein